MADVFEDHAELSSERERLWDLIGSTEQLDWQLLTKRPENVAEMVPWKTWPKNVWLGVSVEDQHWGRQRIPQLLKHRPAIRFLSCEPLVGAVKLDDLLDMPHELDWVIVGGESGPGARPLNLEWIEAIVYYCLRSHIPVFVKQLGSVWARAHGDDAKGGNWESWPSHLRIRQLPGMQSEDPSSPSE